MVFLDPQPAGHTLPHQREIIPLLDLDRSQPLIRRVACMRMCAWLVDCRCTPAPCSSGSTDVGGERSADVAKGCSFLNRELVDSG